MSMKIDNIPFRKLSPNDYARMWLPVTIDFMPNLYVPLPGVRSFLNHFILTVNYPQQVFSLETSE